MGSKRRRRRARRVKRIRTRAKAARTKKTTSRRTRPSQRRNTRPKAKAAPTKTVAKKTESSAPKSRQQKMRDAARKRNENFKKTRVQTHGGTRKNYSAREARRIRDAGLNFSKVTGGAKNPLGPAPINPNIKMGELMPGVEGFLTKDADKFMSAAPNVNYNFSERDTNLPSMRTLSKADLSGFSKSLGINRDQFKGGKNAFSGSPSDLGYTFRNMFQAKDLGNMTTNAINTMVDKLPFGERLPNLRPMSMADRDRQSYLGFNPRKGGRYLSQKDRPKTMQMGGDRRLILGGEGKPNPNFVEEKPVEKPVEDTTVNTSREDLNDVTRAAYDEAMADYGSTTSGSGSTTTKTGPMGSMAGAMGMLAGFAGNRGRKRFRYGRKRGGDRMLSRGSQRFDAMKLPTFTFKGLNI